MNFQDRMNALRVAYVATLPERERELAGLVQAALDVHGKKALCESLHQLVGTAGTHGLIEIADAARAFERALLRLPSQLQERPLALSTEATTLSLAMHRSVSGASTPEVGVPSPTIETPVAFALPRRVLLVDDSPSIRSVARLTLERAGCLVRVLSGGTGVVETVCEAQTELVILDVTMQPISGTAVLSVLREDSRTEGVPVAFLTALSELDPTELSLALKHALREPGVLGVVHKPFTPQSFELAIRSLWSQRISSRAKP
jgi:CheY-like chemotaxis protein/HPt (histidine-containing phosphotransfer) domain-containing protein